MQTDDRYGRLIPMVRAVLDTMDGAIAADERLAAELGRTARTLARGCARGREGEANLLHESRQHAIRALEARGRRAALLAQYGLVDLGGE